MTRQDLYLASQQQGARVLAVLSRLQGPENARHIKEIAHLAGVEERFCRNAYADFDGTEFVLGKCADGLFVARSRKEAERFDAEIDATLRTSWKRRRARRSWWKKQTEVKQLDLWEDRWSA